MRLSLAPVLIAALCASGCGADRQSPLPAPTPVPAPQAPAPAPAPAPTPAPAPAPTPAPPSGPRTQFGAGQWRVGTDIAAGRYFGAPRSGCYWERQKGLSGSISDVIANEFIIFTAAQWIVDIRSSDVAFETDADCGTWSTSNRVGAQSNIPPGVWLVGSQITPGTYRVDARSGCYWERLRHFDGTLDGIIANEFVSAASQQLVTISSTDVGFHSDSDCGTWTRSSGQEAPAISARSTSSVNEKRDQHRRGWPPR